MTLTYGSQCGVIDGTVTYQNALAWLKDCFLFRQLEDLLQHNFAIKLGLEICICFDSLYGVGSRLIPNAQGETYAGGVEVVVGA